MKTNFFLIAIWTALSATARAEIPTEFRQINGANSCIQQKVESQNSDGVVQVVDGIRCHTLYSDLQLIEVVVENRGFEKQMYIYDRTEMYEFERAITVRLVKDRYKFDFQDGAAMYLGKTEDGRDRFIVSLVSVIRPSPAAPIDVYVKMNGAQFQATSVKLNP